MAEASPDFELRRVQTDPTDFHTPESYIHTISEYAQVANESSLYPGHRFESLSQFLQTPQATSIIAKPKDLVEKSITCDDSRTRSHVTHYALTADSRAEPTHLLHPKDLERIARSVPNSRTGELLILQGYPSAAWLSYIGALYDVDPEFFLRHVKGLRASNDVDHIDGVSDLPSSTSSIFQFRISTPGSFTGPVDRSHPVALSDLRYQAQEVTRRYLHQIAASPPCPGEAVLRGITIHDEENLNIEQIVTVYFSRLRVSPDRWLGECRHPQFNPIH